MCDMQEPAPAVHAKGNLAARNVSPQGRIQLYDDVEWEEFIREWATALTPSYIEIKRFGGPGDRGADIAGFKSERGFEGPWDCFQGKHYANALNFADAAPEILKVFLAVADCHWTMPDKYLFLAPRGCGTQLNHLLSHPTKLKQRFLQELQDPKKPLGRELSVAQLAAVVALATATDFVMFRSIELLDALAQHQTTPYYVSRFGAELAARPSPQSPPDALQPGEARYVEQLLAVYNERLTGENIRSDTVTTHAEVGDHFKRQREAFYKAESLRVYARDSVPPGTFELLQDDIFTGVVDVVEESHPDGWTRLSRVLTHVTTLALQHHTLIQVSDLDDRKGVCHQLANEDRILWTRAP